MDKNIFEKIILNKCESFRFECKVSAIEFKQKFIDSVPFNNFVIDENNQDIINQLFHYLNKNEQFDGDVEKGIILIGAIGCGKTSLMEIIFSIIEEYGRKIIINLNSKDLAKEVINNLDYYRKRPLFIDDIGKEPLETLNFGSAIRPFEDILELRYRSDAITFGTSNYIMDDLGYNKHTKDRMKEMFNFIVLPGKSRRK